MINFLVRRSFIAVLALLLFISACNLPAPTALSTVNPNVQISPTASLDLPAPTAVIPVTGNDLVSIQCQFCVNDEPHALLMMPDRASFLVSYPVIGVNCMTVKVVNAQRVVLCRGVRQTTFTLNVCVEDSNCLQLPVPLANCPTEPQTGFGTTVATFAPSTPLAPTPITTQIIPSMPANTATLPPNPTVLVPLSATASIVPSHPQPTRSVPTTPQPTVSNVGLQDPGEFTRWYFGQVWQVRDYENLWNNYLTPSFQAHASNSDFAAYEDWWGSVERVDVNSVSVLQNTGLYAWVRVVLTFTMIDGRVIANQEYDYELMSDASRQTWMFDYRA